MPRTFLSRKFPINPDKNLEVIQLVERINARQGTTFKPGRRYFEGENQGAYRLIDSGNTSLVLKWNSRPGWLDRIQLARKITDRLRRLSPLVPEYVLAGAFPEGENYWLQTALPGNPASGLTVAQVQALIGLNELQAGQAISQKQNWSAYIKSVVFEDISGWKQTLHTYSTEGAELLTWLDHFVYGLEDVCNKTGDIVHGDLTPGNILLEDNRVSGVVDWDAAGCGDRAFDVGLLLFYCYENYPVRHLLTAYLLEITGPERLKVYLVYTVLSQIDWSIRHHSPQDVERLLVLANLITGDFEHL